MVMETDIFAQQVFGKIALQKLAPVPENFRLYYAAWLGAKPDNIQVMKVVGAEFRAAKKGPNKGNLSILIKGTQRTTYVTNEELKNNEIFD